MMSADFRGMIKALLAVKERMQRPACQALAQAFSVIYAASYQDVPLA